MLFPCMVMLILFPCIIVDYSRVTYTNNTCIEPNSKTWDVLQLMNVNVNVKYLLM
jgi:hypothetical protein